jgi:PleD family two-component response regulator
LVFDNSFDAIILDLQMSVIDRFQTAESIRRVPACPSISILLFTSNHTRGGDPRAAELGISASIYKPVRPKQLLDSLNQTFDRRKISIRRGHVSLASDSSLAARLPLRIHIAGDSRVNQMVGARLLEKFGY